MSVIITASEVCHQPWCFVQSVDKDQLAPPNARLLVSCGASYSSRSKLSLNRVGLCVEGVTRRQKLDGKGCTVSRSFLAAAFTRYCVAPTCCNFTSAEATGLGVGGISHPKDVRRCGMGKLRSGWVSMSPRKSSSSSRYTGINRSQRCDLACIDLTPVSRWPLKVVGVPLTPVLVTPGIRHLFLGNVAVDPQPWTNQICL